MIALIIAFAAAFFGSLVRSDPISIQYLPAYTLLRYCVAECYGGGAGLLAVNLGCQNPYQNQCFCRSDLQITATAYLASCANLYCSGASVDVMSATSIYISYCSVALLAPATTTSAVTSSTTATTFRTFPTATLSASTTNPTSTPTSSGSTPSSTSGTGITKTYGGLSEAELIGVVIGVAGFIASAMGAFYGYKAIQHRRYFG